MCECNAESQQRPLVSRRGLLCWSSSLVLAIPFLSALPSSPRAEARDLDITRLRGLPVRPRDDWGADLPPTGPLESERPEDVHFLLVHHTASSNAYGSDDVQSLIRSIYTAHTGPEKEWPDVAYNFFVDRFGEIWEGRAGSLIGPVKADATGGSQGYALLCCFIGDHQVEAPTAEARQAMIQLLAGLADTYAIDTAPGATAAFISRGSNRWTLGASVTATTISGHRDMSRTACPGDAAYDLVQTVFPAAVSEMRAASANLAAPVDPGLATTAPRAAPTSGFPPSQAQSDADTWSTPTTIAGGLAAVAAALGLLGVAARRSTFDSRAPSSSEFEPGPNRTGATPPCTTRDSTAAKASALPPYLRRD
jgi:hypothetical protein